MFKTFVKAASAAFVGVIALGTVAAKATETLITGASGYDLVAYFTEDRAVEGSTAHTAIHEGVTYLFSKAEHKDAFEADPAKYLPAYGGYCAFGAAVGKKFPIDPHAFKVVDGKLYLNNNKKVQDRWLTDIAGYIKLGDDNWENIKNVPAGEL
ncbi:YHS domain-containing (seleno)protein [Kiloniella sp. b19]|uniref:YHS domain-containing (seleno)protein n=1 Tax=Kiloniella sp. GXU_MW_B19 TaxID=3141326 RepID=UPI0031E00444